MFNLSKVLRVSYRFQFQFQKCLNVKIWSRKQHMLFMCLCIYMLNIMLQFATSIDFINVNINNEVVELSWLIHKFYLIFFLSLAYMHEGKFRFNS